jgi:hypothetical protein
MRNNLFHIALLITTSTACNGPVSTSALATKAPVVTQIIY